MPKSLLFIPDISGFTQFVQTTEVEHSQHVIAELLEILIDANEEEYELAEVEGDALFFYKEGQIPSSEKLFSKIEQMFSAFYGHLKLLETNRICPCNACSSAPNLNLKIIAHSGEMQFINIKEQRKPFGSQVIEVHRLMKNSIDSNNYILLSKSLTDDIKLTEGFQSQLYDFQNGFDKYDGKEMDYSFSNLNKSALKLKPFEEIEKIKFDHPAPLSISKTFPISATKLLEYITNYNYRLYWIEGVDKFEYNENEVTKIGTKHLCVVNGKEIDFRAVSKDGKPGQFIYGELTVNQFPIDEIYQFYIVSPINENSCKLEMEIYWKANSPLKKIAIALFAKKAFRSNMTKGIEGLYQFIKKDKS